jgi:hypothetical protein
MPTTEMDAGLEIHYWTSMTYIGVYLRSSAVAFNGATS